MDWWVRGQRIESNPSNIFSIYLNEELNQKVNNKNKNNNNNSSNSLVFGRWPQTRMESNNWVLKRRFASPSNPLSWSKRHLTGDKYSQNWVFWTANCHQKDGLASSIGWQFDSLVLSIYQWNYHDPISTKKYRVRPQIFQFCILSILAEPFSKQSSYFSIK